MPIDDEKLILRAAKRGDVATVQALIKKNQALLRARDTDGSTPLHCAAWKGHAEVVEALLAAGADIDDHNQNDHWGTTPLHAAAHGNQKNVAEVLIAQGADLNARNLNNRTPLEETEVHNSTAVAKLLRAAGARASR
jgi:ankyrin repeat protein